MHKSHPCAYPLCPATDETDDHVCLCLHATVADIRQQAIATPNLNLQSWGMDPTLCILFLHGITSWLNGKETTHDINPPADHPYTDHLHTAIAEQNAIEWNQICCSCISHAWGKCYLSWATLTVAPFSKPPMNPLRWTTNIAKWGLQLMLQLWDNHNSIAHQPTGNNAPTLTHTCLEAEVCERYSRLSSLSQSNTDAYFSTPVAGQLLWSTNVLVTWVKQVDSIFIRHRKEVNQCTRHSQITYYFQPE
jgi:hypothetical protein